MPATNHAAMVGPPPTKNHADSGYSAFVHELDADALEGLTAQRSKGFKVQANGKDYAFGFGKKPVDKIQKIIACIWQEWLPKPLICQIAPSRLGCPPRQIERKQVK